MFSCIALPDTFLAVRRASGPLFMFCAATLIFGDTQGVRTSFHVLRSRTRFRRYGGYRFQFSCFAFPDTFSAVRRASGPVFMFCVLGLIFGGSEGVGSRFIVLRPLLDFNCTDGVRTHFHIMHSRTRFRQCGGCQVPFSCFASSYSFSVVPRASCPVFMFCTLGLIFGGSKGVGSRFHVLLS
jgi:hypothetical protein